LKVWIRLDLINKRTKNSAYSFKGWGINQTLSEYIDKQQLEQELETNA